MTTQIVPSMEDRLMTVAQIAKIFNVTNYTVRQWIKNNKIKAIKLESGQLRIQESEMVRFANATWGESK